MPLLGFDGFCMVVGKFQGKMLKLKETLSTLCCAPPGTGKTAGVVIPTIFNSEGLSIIVNDPKPELCYQTTGARNKVGPVFVINWGKEDNPATGEYYPSWNPLSPGALRHRVRNATCTSILCATRWWKTPRAALTRTGQKPVEARSAALSILSLPNANGL